MSEENRPEMVKYEFSQREATFLLNALDKTQIMGRDTALLLVVVGAKLAEPLKKLMAENKLQENKEEKEEVKVVENKEEEHEQEPAEEEKSEQ